METCCDQPKEKERSAAVEMVFDLLRNFTWKITNIDGAEMQQKVAIQMFKYLGECNSLEDVAMKLVSIGVNLDKKEQEEEDAEVEDGEALLIAMTGTKGEVK